MFWGAVPCLMTLLLLVLYLAPKHIAGLGHFMPALPLIPIFYWGLFYPHEMPYWFAFAAGLVMDAVTGTPLGMSSLLYIVFLAMVQAQGKFIVREGFILQWGYFAMLLGLASFASWLFLLAVNGQAQGFFSGFIQWILTLCCYPLFHKGFDALTDRIHDRRRMIQHRR